MEGFRVAVLAQFYFSARVLENMICQVLTLKLPPQLQAPMIGHRTHADDFSFAVGFQRYAIMIALLNLGS